MIELLFFQAASFHHLRDYPCNFITRQLTESFRDKSLSYFSFSWVQKKVFKPQILHCEGYLLKFILHLSPIQGKVIVNQFLKHFSFLIIIIDITIDDLLNILDRVYIMHLLTLTMMLDTAFGLANGTLTTTIDAASYMNGF